MQTYLERKLETTNAVQHEAAFFCTLTESPDKLLRFYVKCCTPLFNICGAYFIVPEYIL